MAKTGLFHHVGTFLLFSAFVLLLITTITSPVVNDISMLKVTLANSSAARHSSVTFGTFGYCILDAAPAATVQDYCPGHHVGYSPAKIMTQIETTDFSTTARNTADGLTRVMILHPIVCALSFVAFLLALGAGIIGALLATFVTVITWLLTLVVLVTDFVSFGIIKDHVNREDDSASRARFGAGIWTELAAFILLFFATFVVLFSCLSKRRHRSEAVGRTAKNEYPVAPVTSGAGDVGRKKRFWQRGARV